MSNILKQKVLSILEKSKISIEPNIIFKRVKAKNKPEFLSLLEELKNDGLIISVRKGKITSSKHSGRIPAKITSHSHTFAFAKSESDKSEIFINSQDLKTAMVGDIVLLHKIRHSEKGTSGTVEKILQYGNHLITGKISKTQNGYEIVCDNSIRYNVPINQESAHKIKDNDKVQAILHRNLKRKSLSATITKIYGRSDSARICADAIIDANNIRHQFPDSVIEESKSIPQIISQKEIKSRIDLRDELIFTIDGEDAKDLDDAISIKALESGWELGVHIADVSYYVKRNAAIDNEAFLRGTSVYFADRVIPMLPQSISNGICSLNSGTDKLAFSVLMNLDKRGNLLSYKFFKSVINSKVRGVYSEINSILSGNYNEEVKNKYSTVIDSILCAKELSDIISSKSVKRGVVDIYSGESKFKLNDKGICVEVSPREQGKSEGIIENFMILANQAAALYANSSHIPFIYRVHEPPDPEKIRILSQLTNALGIKSHKIRKGLMPADLSDILRQAKNSTSYRIVSRQVLRTMSKARYDSRPLGHFGLAIDDYCHFTSPIRRYPDTCIHRILNELVSGKNIDDIQKQYSEFSTDASKQSSECEIRAMKAERDTEKCYMAEYMSQHIGEVYEGIISGAISRGVFVELKNSVSGFVNINYYQGHKFVFNGLTSHIDSITGKSLTIGDTISVKAVAANISTGEIDFAPINNL